MATRKTQAQRTAERKALEFLKRLKANVDERKARERARILADENYSTAELQARLALAGKAQKVLNRVNLALKAGRLDANALDRERLREVAGEGLVDYKANLLMRNTLSTAYNAGYREQGLRDNTKAFWYYQTKRDAQVRPAHRKWEGLLLEKRAPLAARIFPPNGHNCRCKMTAVSRARAEELMAKGEATLKKPRIRAVEYVDGATGRRLKTIEGVDPGWLGAPNDKSEAIAKLLERQIALLQDWTPKI